MNGKELVELLIDELDERDIAADQFVNNDYSDSDLEELEAIFGSWDNVSSERTGREYDQQQEVFYFVDHGVYVAITGSYSSWEGTDFSGAPIVEVEQVPSFIYLEKK